MEFIVIVVLFGIATIGVLVWRGRQFGELARRGVAVTGTVERKFRTGAGNAGSMGKRVTFTYRGPDGQEYRRSASLAGSRYADLAEGAPIELVCLPDNPGVSAPAWLVESAREALRRKGG